MNPVGLTFEGFLNKVSFSAGYFYDGAISHGYEALFIVRNNVVDVDQVGAMRYHGNGKKYFGLLLHLGCGVWVWLS